jgi:hypothetical protein
VSNFERVPIKAKPFEEIASSTVINQKNMRTLSGMQDILEGLADKIAEIGTAPDVDRIAELVKTDPKLDPEIRSVLFTYFIEHGINI